MKTFIHICAIISCAACVFTACASADSLPPAVSTNAPEATVPVSLSTNVTAVIHLLESNVEQQTVLAFIENSETPFALAADDIIYLKDLGVSPEIITAMLHRDAWLREHGVVSSVSTNQPAAEQTLASTNVPVYVTNAPVQVNYFYDTLAPYGTWVDLEGSWYWRPHVVVIDPLWRPYYTYGRWIYSDYGWYWNSDYTWGWAPFHYGRWHHHHHHGWLWYPDLVWAPAWVSWRYSDNYCGWAPLPPGAHFVAGTGWHFNAVRVGIDFDFHLGPHLYTYVPVGRVHEHQLHVHAVPPAHREQIHVRSRVVNNHTIGRNNRIVNHGIGVEKVSAASRLEIRPVPVRDVPSAQANLVKGDRVARQGSATVIYHAPPKPPARPAPPVAQRVDDRRSIVRPIPQRPSVSAPPLTGAKARPPAAGAPAGRPSQTQGGISAPPGAAVPATPRAVPPATRPVQPTPRAAPPQQVRPTVPQTRPVPSARQETPRGREQRLSNGSQMHRAQPPASRPPASRPQPQSGGGQRSRHP